MKKLAALLLTLSLIFSLSACGIGNLIKTDKDTNNKNSSKVTIGDKTEISFTETVAVDNDECAIKITELDPDDIFGYVIKVRLENKSDEKTYMYTVESAAINGVQCETIFAADVSPETKANEEITLFTSELKDNGIVYFTDIELTFRVYDNDDWTADDVAKKTVHIYPYGEENAVEFVRETKATDNVIIDNDRVTVTVTGYENDDVWGFGVNLFFVNKTDKSITFGIDDASVNGYMADPFYAKILSAGKCAFGSATWFTSTLDENGITDVEEIKFNLRIYDSDDLFGDTVIIEPVTLRP